MKCEECKYYDKLNYERDEVEHGFCHRYPPVQPEDDMGVCLHITTYNDNWCGEFEAKGTQ